MNFTAGQIVEFPSKDQELVLGVVLSVSGKGVRVLLLNRKETTIAERGVLHCTSTSRTGTADLDRCHERAMEIDRKRSGIAQGIDLAELHQLLVMENRAFSLKEMAGFLFSPPDDDSEAALLRRLTTDTLFFKARKEGYSPVPADELAQAQEREKKRREMEQEESELIAEMKRVSARGPEGCSDRFRAVSESLIQVAALEHEAPVPKRIFEILEKSGFGTGRKLFSLLVSAGLFGPDENLLLKRYKVPVEFPEEVTLEAERLAGQKPPESNRTDLRGVETWAIDSETTLDRDDAFSLSFADGRFTLLVHVADPAEWFSTDSPVDIEASRRGTTIYLPDGNIPMLPKVLSEDHLSLNENSDRQALTLKIGFDETGGLSGFELFKSLIRVTRMTSYDSADELIDREPTLALGVRLWKLLVKRRTEAGAMVFKRQPEIKVILDGERVTLQPRNDGPTQEMIAEFMIWANHLGGRWLAERKVPGVYRVQEPAGDNPTRQTEFKPVEFFQALRSMKKSQTSSRPGLHAGLGVDPYCQITSPIRRYSDLVLHRQITAVLEGRPPLDSGQLSARLAVPDESVRVAEEVMEDRVRYFLLKFLRQEQKDGRETSPGTIVDTSGPEVFVYIDLLCQFRHCRKPSFPIQVGQKVTVRFRQVDPFDRILRFDIEPAVA